MRVAVFSQPRSGTRMLVRGIARSARVGFAFAVPAVPRTELSWVIGTHDVYTEGIAAEFIEAGATIVGVERNPLDHLLSSLGHTDDLDSIIQFGTSIGFQRMRSAMFKVPDHMRVSYDVLANPKSTKYQTEIERVKSLTGLGGPLLLESVKETMASETEPYFGRPGHWRDVLTTEQARFICDAISEPLPE